MRTPTILLLTLVLLMGCSAKSDGPGTSGTPVFSSGEFSMTISFEPTPPQKGSETLTITLKDANGNPVKDAAVTIDTMMPDMRMSGPSLHLQDNGDGTYSAVSNLAYQTKWVFRARADRQRKHSSAEFVQDVK